MIKIIIMICLLSVPAHAAGHRTKHKPKHQASSKVDHKKFTRKFPGWMKHKTVNRCLDESGKWIKGCQ